MTYCKVSADCDKYCELLAQEQERDHALEVFVDDYIDEALDDEGVISDVVRDMTDNERLSLARIIKAHIIKEDPVTELIALSAGRQASDMWRDE